MQFNDKNKYLKNLFSVKIDNLTSKKHSLNSLGISSIGDAGYEVAHLPVCEITKRCNQLFSTICKEGNTRRVFSSISSTSATS